MNCPTCNAPNSEGTTLCIRCNQAMDSLGSAETIALETATLGAAQPRKAPGARGEAVGVDTPPVSPLGARPGSPPLIPSSVILEPGANFGPRYRIEAMLGRGGMGVVYKAYDRELDRLVALKLVRPDLMMDPDALRRFKQEMLLASRISQKNILRIHDLGDVDGVKFISMACVEGEDLHHLLRRQGRCTLEQTLSIARQLCAALEAAHSEGVVHRDLKPQNVLIDREGHAFVTDFGLAKSLEAETSMMTRTGALMGTPRYMSPEQVEGKPADNRSDIYALGLILYEMSTGDVPFTGESVTQMMMQRITQKPKDPARLNPEIPKYFSSIVLRCLETDPAKRYPSAAQIGQDIEAGHASRVVHSLQITLPVPETRRSRLALGVAALVVVTLLGALVAYRLTRPQPAALPRGGVGGVPPLAKGKFLAVIPFRVLGSNAALDYIADGLGESLNARLFSLKGVHLVSPQAVDQAAKKGPIARIAKELGVNLAVEGTLQGGNGQIAVVVNLEDLAHGKLLWAREFTGVPDDLLTLEDQIADKLIGALELHPGSRELEQEAEHPTENVSAYNFYLRGNNALRGLPDAQTLQQALGFYKGALKQDPNFALAYAGLADASLRMYNQTKNRIWVDQATQAAAQAQQLNSTSPEIDIALGSVYSATGKNAQAIGVLQRAVGLAPNSDEGYRQLGKAYEANGNIGRAIKAFKKALQIDPYYWVNADELGKAYDLSSHYRQALAEFQRVTLIDPSNAAGYENLGNVYMQQGEFSRSVPVLEKALQLSPTFWHYSNLGSAYLFVKRYGDAAKTLEKATSASPNHESVTGNLAEAYLFGGQKQKAQQAFNRAITLGYKHLQVNPRDAATMGDLSIYYACLGQSSQALQLIRNARSIDSSNAEYVYDEAVVQALLGKSDLAMQSLRKAFQKGFPALQAASDPQLASLQSRPDFKKLVSQFAAQGR